MKSIFISTFGIAALLWIRIAQGTEIPAADDARTAEAARALALIEYCQDGATRDDLFADFMRAERQRGMDEGQAASIASLLGALQARNQGKLTQNDCTTENITAAQKVMDELVR